jgi:hypothetical protein
MAYSVWVISRLLLLIWHHQQFRLFPNLLPNGVSDEHALLDNLIDRYNTDRADGLPRNYLGCNMRRVWVQSKQADTWLAILPADGAYSISTLSLSSALRSRSSSLHPVKPTSYTSSLLKVFSWALPWLSGVRPL